MIISRKRYEAEIQKRVEEAVCKVQDNIWRDEREREREQNRIINELQVRLIECEKKNGIDHPSHHRGENAVYPHW